MKKLQMGLQLVVRPVGPANLSQFRIELIDPYGSTLGVVTNAFLIALPHADNEMVFPSKSAAETWLNKIHIK